MPFATAAVGITAPRTLQNEDTVLHVRVESVRRTCGVLADHVPPWDFGNLNLILRA